jgi:ubiquinol-cytochrome c reductase cytochrome c subunit
MNSFEKGVIESKSTIVGICAILLMSSISWAQVTTEPISDAAKRGREDFIKLGCYQCHGYQGQGGPGGRIAPDPLPFEAFAEVVRRPPNVMPAYSPKVLSDEPLKRMHEYMESIPQPPDVSSIPALSEE